MKGVLSVAGEPSAKASARGILRLPRDVCKVLTVKGPSCRRMAIDLKKYYVRLEPASQ
jgi:hypothetical protein